MGHQNIGHQENRAPWNIGHQENRAPDIGHPLKQSFPGKIYSQKF